eukprot:4208979-Amphidinium_carterae.2
MLCVRDIVLSLLLLSLLSLLSSVGGQLSVAAVAVIVARAGGKVTTKVTMPHTQECRDRIMAAWRPEDRDVRLSQQARTSEPIERRKNKSWKDGSAQRTQKLRAPGRTCCGQRCASSLLKLDLRDEAPCK